jgi:DNA polymerase III subunit gamma/tau
VAYLSLYRKYRPQTFAEVVGQTQVTETLAHATAAGTPHHAYLFTGPRGTGKTSTARILAKALNCEQGPTDTPCNTCSHCTQITAGQHVDVIEIDAASHGGVDDVRDLRERVVFAPASARTKVYIVDECHMLSTAGWNAFLKTVEEPPGHVVFVFATTEPHKVLDTILSRTQRFDFRRVPAAALADHLTALGELEQLSFEPGAVDLVVRAGDGSVRDALSVLEQVVAFTGSTVTVQGVADVLGAVPDQLLAETADLLATGDAAGLCVLVQRLTDAGHDPRQFARDAVEHLRALFMFQVAPDAQLVDGTPERLAALQAQADRLGTVQLLRAIELLADAQAQMRRGNTRLPLELALVKAALPEASGDPAALAARMDRLERRGGVDPVPEPSPAPALEPTPVEPAPAEPVPAPEPAEPAPEPEAQTGSADAVDIDLVRQAWPALMEKAKERSRQLQAFLLPAVPTAVDGTALTVTFSASFHAEQCMSEQWRPVITELLGEVFGAGLELRCVVGGEPAEPVAEADPLDEEADAVAESEAAEAAGELPDADEAHDRAIDTLTRGLGASVVDDS